MQLRLQLRLRWWAICKHEWTKGYWPISWLLVGYGAYWDGYYKLDIETPTGWGSEDVKAALLRAGFLVQEVGLAKPYPWFPRKYSYSEAWGDKAL